MRFMRFMRFLQYLRWLGAVGLLGFVPTQVQAQAHALDVPYVTTPQVVVDAMLKIANVGANDFLIDLGSGDGRIVINAAKKFGTRGFGVDLDDNLVRIARRNAESEGVKDRAEFFTRNLFDTDLGKASVISMYLFNSVNLRLRPSLFKLKPGTRLVSHDFDMAKWTPDAKLTIDVPGKSYGPPQSDIFLWVVPADFSGSWTWRMPIEGASHAYDVAFEQTFQMAEGKGRVAARPAPVGEVSIRGDTIRFVMGATIDGKTTWRDFRGRISGDEIIGNVVTVVQGDAVNKSQEPAPWRATRTARGKMIIDVSIDPMDQPKLAARV